MSPVSTPNNDDVSIGDAAILWRRIHPTWWVKDHNNGGRRISSEAFDDSDDGSPMSVAITAECAGTGTLLNGFPGYGLASLTAGDVRQCKQGVVKSPTKSLPAHASVVGRKTRGNRRCMRKKAQVVVTPIPAFG